MQPDIASPTAAQQEIHSTNRKFEAAFNAGDPARAAREVYTRDARLLPPGAPLIRGRDNIEQFWPAATQQFGMQRERLPGLQQQEVVVAVSVEVGGLAVFITPLGARVAEGSRIGVRARKRPKPSLTRSRSSFHPGPDRAPR